MCHAVATTVKVPLNRKLAPPEALELLAFRLFGFCPQAAHRNTTGPSRRFPYSFSRPWCFNPSLTRLRILDECLVAAAHVLLGSWSTRQPNSAPVDTRRGRYFLDRLHPRKFLLTTVPRPSPTSLVYVREPDLTPPAWIGPDHRQR